MGVLEHQLDIFLLHEFLLDQHLMFSDLDHKQGDKKTDPIYSKTIFLISKKEFF
jgi:hypothetical protein